ncbi:Histidine kinase [Spirosomataceae bacterium TFI 002]|nr:Histidine kinase [Spirosomataceae bacterium TFI 002]
MKIRFIFTIVVCFVAFQSFSQEIQVEAIRTFVSENKDSIYIQGLDNNLIINFSEHTGEKLSYQLVGFDTKLIQNPFPSLRYTNLPGGKYLLKYHFGSSNEFKEIKISVMEAVWQKWWFWPMILAYIFIILGVGSYLFFLYNFRQKLKIQEIRNRISADLHDEVGSNLSSIAIFSQVLKKQVLTNPGNVDEVINKIIANSKESVTLMQDTVWALNPQNDSTDKLIGRLINFGTAILGEKKIAFNHEVEIDALKLKLDMESRKNCYLILKEGINNIAKHSDAINADLHIFQKGDRTYFILKDDGKGFDTTLATEGNGLRNYRERAEESEFDITIVSKKGEGTVLELVC